MEPGKAEAFFEKVQAMLFLSESLRRENHGAGRRKLKGLSLGWAMNLAVTLLNILLLPVRHC